MNGWVDIWQLIASPFFLVGSVLWTVSPIMCYVHGEDSTCLAIGLAASFCFLFDCTFCVLAWRADTERTALALVSVTIYGAASVVDCMSAFLDLSMDAGAPYWVTVWADAGFTIAGSVEAVVNLRRHAWVPLVGSFFFATGGLSYLVSGFLCEFLPLAPGSPEQLLTCWIGDIIGAGLFCVNALVIFLPLFLPLVRQAWLRLRAKDENKPLFLRSGEESQSMEEEEEEGQQPSEAISMTESESEFN